MRIARARGVEQRKSARAARVPDGGPSCGGRASEGAAMDAKARAHVPSGAASSAARRRHEAAARTRAPNARPVATASRRGTAERARHRATARARRRRDRAPRGHRALREANEARVARGRVTPRRLKVRRVPSAAALCARGGRSGVHRRLRWRALALAARKPLESTCERRVEFNFARGESCSRRRPSRSSETMPPTSTWVAFPPRRRRAWSRDTRRRRAAAAASAARGGDRVRLAARARAPIGRIARLSSRAPRTSAVTRRRIHRRRKPPRSALPRRP